MSNTHDSTFNNEKRNGSLTYFVKNKYLKRLRLKLSKVNKKASNKIIP